MALKKSEMAHESEPKVQRSLDECILLFWDESDMDGKRDCIEDMKVMDGGIEKMLELLEDKRIDKVTITQIFSHLGKLDAKDAPIDAVLHLLKLQNAYIRNHAISLLQSYGKEIKYYIVKYLISPDRDLRIFAVNILGDVKFEESRDMLLEMLEKEEDVNAAMTAVDYLSEIGQPGDVEFLKQLGARFSDEPYAQFAISNAIKSILR